MRLISPEPRKIVRSQSARDKVQDRQILVMMMTGAELRERGQHFGAGNINHNNYSGFHCASLLFTLSLPL